MMFPSFPRYCGQVFHEAKDKDLALLCVQAWNDCVLEEFAGDHPGRFIPMMIIPLWDPAAAVGGDRAHRGARRQVDRVLREPDQARPAVDPHRLLGSGVRGVQRRPDFVISMHVGSSSNLIRTSDDMPTLAFMAYSAAANQAGTLLDWLFSAASSSRHPNLKIALSEGSIGWMPYFLERAEQVIDKQRYWASRMDINMSAAHDRGEKMAEGTFDMDTDIRQLFADHVFGTFIEDEAGIRLLDIIGEDNVMLECDYPHSDSTWPDTMSMANKWFGHLSEEVQHKITIGNACRVYDFTPADPASIVASWRRP